MSDFIDMTPTWKSAAMIYVAAIQNGTPEGVKAGIAGINEMAAACDSLNEKITAMNDEAKTKGIGKVESMSDWELEDDAVMRAEMRAGA
tara:strand:+ start:1187 stop:1453 length:267 start_codon:yes stop_codon:yes gene_type:complete